MIPARFDFDQVVYSQRRCVYDGALLDERSSACLECGGSEFRTLEERIKGWVGIQRFDDNNRFGIDLVRNGRAIRVAEKDAFFSYSDALESEREYPTDQQTGRIVGEVHLDHVPVDFQKQDFQRSSEEWQRAMDFLRGGSLLPGKWPAGQRNETPVSKLFQGYRKVRNPGREDMYMGRWDDHAGKGVRLSRKEEAEMYVRFVNHEPGYYDDARWWELVETANTPPVQALEKCPDCGFQNLPSDDVCGDCGRLIKAKACIACSAEIPKSAAACPECGASQIPDVQEPWRCLVCGGTNGIDDESCGTCASLRGEEDPTSVAVLRRVSEDVPTLSFDSRSFLMADGGRTEPLTAAVRRTGTMRAAWNGHPVPTITFRTAGHLEIFIDLMHPTFTQLGVHPEEAVAVEAAQYLYSVRSDLAGRPGHSVHTIASRVLVEVWGDQLAAGPEKIREGTRLLFTQIADRLAANPDAADFYGELDQFELREITDRLISAGSLDELPTLRANGGYLRYAPASVIPRFFLRRPDGWFGTVWTDRLPDADQVGAQAAENWREQVIGVIGRCLEDCAAFVRFGSDDALILARARASQEYLEARLA